jgi:hypothetical protein
MVIDNQVTLTGSMNWTGGAAQNSENLNLGRIEDHCSRLRRTLESASCAVVALCTARGLVPLARGGRLQIGIIPVMKPDREGWFGAGGTLRGPGECSAQRPQPSEIVGEIENPMLETMRRLWWRGFDRGCYCIAAVRLWVFDRVHGPQAPTAADLHRETGQRAARQGLSRGR